MLADLLRYELAVIELQTGNGGPEASSRALRDARAQAPVCHPALRVVELAHDLAELLARAYAGLIAFVAWPADDSRIPCAPS